MTSDVVRNSKSRCYSVGPRLCDDMCQGSEVRLLPCQSALYASTLRRHSDAVVIPLSCTEALSGLYRLPGVGGHLKPLVGCTLAPELRKPWGSDAMQPDTWQAQS